jgi:tRNA-splicing ligase RtcB
MNTAANYAAVNRLLLVEMVRDRLRECFPRLELPLVFDAPHNIVTEENGCYVHRKGATPARFGHPVLIPGSMGQASYLMVGLGNERFLQSASHGAGRKLSRRDMHRLDKQGVDLGLGAIECVTLKNERLVQEAPAAYKDIGEVVSVQADAGIATPVARLRPTASGLRRTVAPRVWSANQGQLGLGQPTTPRTALRTALGTRNVIWRST